MKALLIVDVQNDFMPGGALGVRGADEILSSINRLQEEFELIIATQDWHPADHKSFIGNNRNSTESIDNFDSWKRVLWKDHCVQGSSGAAFHKGLNTARISKVIQKGVDPEIDSYSAFYDNEHKRSTGLSEYLKEKGVTDVTIVGLATDYCVKYSALDSIKEGFRTTVDLSGCRGIDLVPGDIDSAVSEMIKAGVKVTV